MTSRNQVRVLYNIVKHIQHVYYRLGHWGLAAEVPLDWARFLDGFLRISNKYFEFHGKEHNSFVCPLELQTKVKQRFHNHGEGLGHLMQWS